MRYDEEVIQSFGCAHDHGAEFRVVVCQPYLDAEFRSMGLDTPNGRRWQLSPRQQPNSPLP